jgi:hypothetical protein
MSKTRNKFSAEVRERAVRMVGEHRADYGSEWEVMTSGPPQQRRGAGHPIRQPSV